jgi:DNA repair exonuclease SbcCD nuclease subunit
VSGAVAVACIGDTHLLHGHDRNQDRLDAFDEAIAIGSRVPHLAAWVHLGDVYHQASAPEDRAAAIDRFVRMAAIAPVVVVEGNHGRPGDTAIFRRLKAENVIRVVTEPEILRYNGVAIGVLPYPSKVSMVAAGATREAQSEASRHAFDLMAIGTAGSTTWQTADRRLLVGHLTIAGAVTSVGQPLVGSELEMDPATLARYGDVPKVFGHIHKHQRVGDAIYCGSSCRMDWGETEPKGLVVVEWDESGAWSWRFERLNVAPMYHVEIRLAGGAVVESRIAKGPDGPADDPPTARVARIQTDERMDLFADVDAADEIVDWTGCDVRARVRYPSSERALLQAGLLAVRQSFAAARRLEIEPIAVDARELRAPEVIRAATLDEKLKAWARLTGVVWAPTIDRCVNLLLSTDDGDAVVRDVETRIDAERVAPEAVCQCD